MSRSTFFVIFISVFLSSHTARAVSCAQYLEIVESKSRKELDRFYDRYHFYPVPEKSIPTLMEYFNVKEAGNFPLLSSEEKTLRLNKLFAQLAKIPSIQRNKIYERFHVEIVDKSLGEYPDHKNWSEFKTDRHYQTNKFVSDALQDIKTFEGLFKEETNQVIVRSQNTADDTIIHEMGHAKDFLREESETPTSLTPEFIKAQVPSWLEWENSYYMIPRESYAEAFRRFYSSKESRDKLKKEHPALFDYFEARLGIPPKKLSVSDSEPAQSKIAAKALPSGNGLLNTTQLRKEIHGKLPGKELVKSIKAFEASGGEGKWLTAPHLLGQTGQEGLYYLVTKVPSKPTPDAPIFLLRTKNGVEAMQELLKQGTPFLMGNIPQEFGLAFVAANQFELTKRVLSLTGDKEHKNVLVLAANSDLPILRHEQKHWKDFENPQFMEGVKSDIENLSFVESLPKADIDLLFRTVWEIRGHGAQEDTILKSLEKGDATLDRVGNILKASKANADFDRRMLLNAFTGAYYHPLADLLGRLKKESPAGYQELLRYLQKYDHSNSDGLLRLDRIFDGHFKNLSQTGAPTGNSSSQTPISGTARSRWFGGGQPIVFTPPRNVNVGTTAGTYKIDSKGVTLTFPTGAVRLEFTPEGKLRTPQGQIYSTE
jgi:hypothetical protein